MKRKVLYVGLDVHKETNFACAMDHSGKVIFERAFGTQHVKIVKHLKAWEEHYDLSVVYEAGCTGFALQRKLRDAGIQCVIAAPGKIPRSNDDRIKTDRKDAQKLARLLRNTDITPIYILNSADEAVRDLLRARGDLRKEFQSNRNRLLGFLLRQGTIYRGGHHWTKKHYTWLNNLSFEHTSQRSVFGFYYAQIITLKKRLEEMDLEINELAKFSPHREMIGRLRCFHGIDTLTAVNIFYEIGDFRRFRSAAQFMAFTGLVPSEHSSGSKKRQGSITKTGNSELRRLFVESAWHFRYGHGNNKRLAERRKGQPGECIAYADIAFERLRKKFSRMNIRQKSPKTIVTAVARELSGFVWGMMTENWA